MSCFFQRGNRNAGTPASIIAYGFNRAFTQLRIAFTVNNPVTAIATAIPLTVYTVTGTTAFTKTFYQNVEKAILVVGTAATEVPGQQVQPQYSTPNLGVSAQLTIALNLDNDMAINDYYVIKTPPMGTTTGSFTTNTIIPGFGTADVLILPQNQYVIIRPNANTANNGVYTASIPNVFTPGTATPLTFSATITYFSLMSGSKVTYAGATFDAFPNPPQVTMSNLDSNRNSLMTITLNTVYRGVRSVIIDTGARVTLRDCYENTNSQTQILQCAVNDQNNLILITLEDREYPAGARDLSIDVPITNGPAGALGAFSYYVYSTVETNPTVAAGRSYAAQNVNTGLTIANQAPLGPEPNRIEFVYVPYAEERNRIVNNNLGDLIIGATLANAINAGDQVTITLENFQVQVAATNTGDVTSRAAAIITQGGNQVLALATIAGGDTIRFNVPAGTNLPAGANVNFRITQIQRIGDNVGLTARTTTNAPLQVTMSSDNGNEPSAQVVSFLTKDIDPGRAPIRIRFNLANALPVNTGLVTLTLPPNEFNYDQASNPICYFRTYQNDLDFTEQVAANCEIAGTLAQGWTITATAPYALAANQNHELIVETDSPGNPHFNQVGNPNRQLRVGFTSGGANLAGSIIPLYEYEATPLLEVTNFYYTSLYAGDPNTIILELTANLNIPAFPASLIELELSSATGSIIQEGQTAAQREIRCGIVGINARGASEAPTRCVIVNSEPPKVRIENYAAIGNGNDFYLILYDLNNAVIAQDYIGAFNAKLIMTNLNTGRQSQDQLTRMFSGRGGSIEAATITTNFPTSSSLIYDTRTTLTRAVNWGAGDSCTDCRFIVRGIDTDWIFPDTDFTFSINGNAQNVLVDTTNNIFGNTCHY